MFHCELCQRIVAPQTPAHQVVWETRAKTYPFRKDANPAYQMKFRPGQNEAGEPRLRGYRVRQRKAAPKPQSARDEHRRDADTDTESSRHDHGGKGCEIVRELRLCPDCASRVAFQRLMPRAE